MALFDRWRYFAERNARKQGRLARGRTGGGVDAASMPAGFTVSAVVTRADGTKEDLGVIAQHTPDTE
jgi:hypothetical protein